jgi:hypothetical protein
MMIQGKQQLLALIQETVVQVVVQMVARGASMTGTK